jgi:hypothetical protein
LGIEFCEKKKGRLTYNPKKVFADNLGNSQKINEIWAHEQPKSNLISKGIFYQLS